MAHAIYPSHFLSIIPPLLVARQNYPSHLHQAILTPLWCRFILHLWEYVAHDGLTGRGDPELTSPLPSLSLHYSWVGVFLCVKSTTYEGMRERNHRAAVPVACVGACVGVLVPVLVRCVSVWVPVWVPVLWCVGVGVCRCVCRCVRVPSVYQRHGGVWVCRCVGVGVWGCRCVGVGVWVCRCLVSVWVRWCGCVLVRLAMAWRHQRAWHVR